MKRISYLETQLNYLEAHANDLERKVARLAWLLEQRKKKPAVSGPGPETAGYGAPEHRVAGN